MSSDPENKPPVDYTSLIPILLGAFSLLGILLVLVIGRFNSNRPAVSAPDTATPFKYLLIGTEPGISTLGAETPEPDSIASPTGAPVLVVTAQQGTKSSSSGTSSSSSSGDNPSATKTTSSFINTAASNATSPIIILNPGTKSATPEYGIIIRTAVPTRTPYPTPTLTPSRTKNATSTASTILATPQVPLPPGTYDDSHPLLAYNGWVSQTDDTSAYLGTLHVSNTIGSTLTFRFTGQQIRIMFQGVDGLGTIRMNISGLNFYLEPDPLNQSNGTNEWVVTAPAQGTYTVTITHLSGGSVNIDYIVIPDPSTPIP